MKNVNLIWVMSLLLITLIHSTACVPPAITKIFKFDNKPPQIGNVTISAIGERSAAIKWISDEIATSWIVVSDKYVCWSLGENATLTINHEAIIDPSYCDIKCNRNYEITIYSRDTNENQAQYDFSTILINCTLAPDFTLNNLSGQTVSLSDFKGKNVLLHFWSYWCPPCTWELPLFQSFYSGLPRDKLELLTISVSGDITTVNKYITGQGYKFPVLFDSDGAIDKKYKNSGVPASYLISSDGYIIDKHAGAFDSLDDMRKFTGTQY